jgi:uncharacterized membrane protein YbhN (UPF0104 family)
MRPKGKAMRGRKAALNLAVATAAAFFCWLLYRNVSRYSPAEIVASIGAIPFEHLALSIAFAAASYGCLTGFDAFGLVYAGKPLAYRKAALTSFVSLSIGHNIGLSALSSGAIRYRFYSRWGLTAEDVTKVVLFSGGAVTVGLLSLCGWAMLLSASSANVIGLGRNDAFFIGLAFLAALALYLVLCWRIRRLLTFRKWKFNLPSLPLAIAQLVLGTINFAFIAASLQQLLLAYQDVNYWDVSAVYAIANGMAIATHVPGGLGVLEATTQFLLPQAATIGAVIAFRCVYFFLPLPFGLLLLAISERIFRKGASKTKSVSAQPRP